MDGCCAPLAATSKEGDPKKPFSTEQAPWGPLSQIKGRTGLCAHGRCAGALNRGCLGGDRNFVMRTRIKTRSSYGVSVLCQADMGLTWVNMLSRKELALSVGWGD